MAAFFGLKQSGGEKSIHDNFNSFDPFVWQSRVFQLVLELSCSGTGDECEADVHDTVVYRFNGWSTSWVFKSFKKTFRREEASIIYRICFLHIHGTDKYCRLLFVSESNCLSIGKNRRGCYQFFSPYVRLFVILSVSQC